MLRAEAKLKQSIVKYDLLLQQIDDTSKVLEAQYNLNSDKIIIRSTELGTLGTMIAARIATCRASSQRCRPTSRWRPTSG